MGIFGENPEAVNIPAKPPPAAMFGCRKGQAWVADDVFVTRCKGGEMLIERWDGHGVRFATIRKDSANFLHEELWAKLNEVAIDGAPD